MELDDWYDPLSLLFEEGEDPSPLLVPYWCHLVHLMAPLAAADPLTARQWTYAVALLDRQPEPEKIQDWLSRWRNFLEYLWKAVADHLARVAKMEQARIARARPKAPPPAAPPVQGRLEL